MVSPVSAQAGQSLSMRIKPGLHQLFSNLSVKMRVETETKLSINESDLFIYTKTLPSRKQYS